MPAIERRYRTVGRPPLPGHRRRVARLRSALLQIGLAHPERFGLVLAFSPVLADPAIAAYLAAAWPPARPAGPSRLLVDFDDDPVGRADQARFAAIVAAAPDRARQTALVQTLGGRHAIASWAQRVVPDLQHLLATPCAD